MAKKIKFDLTELNGFLNLGCNVQSICYFQKCILIIISFSVIETCVANEGSRNNTFRDEACSFPHATYTLHVCTNMLNANRLWFLDA